jgi:hypothetical protein
MKKKKNRQFGDKSYIFTKEEGQKINQVDKFPIENVVELKSYQKGKPIRLQTYKYPAKGEVKGVVYLMYNYIIQDMD